ncbi:MAG: aminoglycoside phosphotransferase family protein [Caulobacteraceae bacterium]
MRLDDLLVRIRGEFPDLRFAGAALNLDGDDHAVVILDERWVFRFPRGRERLGLFRAELAVLPRVAEVSPLAVPRYAYVSRDRDFGGYALIAGREMRPAVFAALSGEARATVLGQIAGFLRALHGLDPALLDQPGVETARSWSAGDYARRWRAVYRGKIATIVAPDLLIRIDRFYDAFEGRPVGPRACIVHDDLTDDHMLLAPAGDRLAGIIDFGDVAIGDPAHDLAFFWSWGEAAAGELAALYDPGGADPAVLDRSRWWFARYVVGSLRWGDDGAVEGRSRALLARLPEVFSSLGV